MPAYTPGWASTEREAESPASNNAAVFRVPLPPLVRRPEAKTDAGWGSHSLQGQRPPGPGFYLTQMNDPSNNPNGTSAGQNDTAVNCGHARTKAAKRSERRALAVARRLPHACASTHARTLARALMRQVTLPVPARHSLTCGDIALSLAHTPHALVARLRATRALSGRLSHASCRHGTA